MSAVGIDAVEIWTGKTKLDLPGTFAEEVGDDPEKYTKGLGLYNSSFPDIHEDIVTMAANAAHRLLERRDLRLEDIGRIDVATESSFDNSKPVSTYVAGCLEQVHTGNLHHANKGERKFACIAGTQSLDDAYNWIKAGRHRGRKALVIATDTALYARGNPGEATQGAGAVAMLMGEDPNLVELETEQGVGSADETDFLKPNQQFPSVDGKRSIKVYLARMREALEDYESMVGDLDPDDFAYIPFHTPFPGMVRKAGLLGFRHLMRGTSYEDRLDGEVGTQPDRSNYEHEQAYEDDLREFMDRLAETEVYQSWYGDRIEPTLSISREVGNWYTGSVHLARVSSLMDGYETDTDLAGQRLLVGSYGSGAQAEIHAETVAAGWDEEIGALDITSQLENRYDLDYEEYELIHDAHTHGKDVEADAFTEPENEFVFDGWGEMGERKYRYVD